MISVIPFNEKLFDVAIRQGCFPLAVEFCLFGVLVNVIYPKVAVDTNLDCQVLFNMTNANNLWMIGNTSNKSQYVVRSLIRHASYFLRESLVLSLSLITIIVH